jgi:4-amino-4-deoxy-L-arabinose transferase-like glycosyltransferase
MAKAGQPAEADSLFVYVAMVGCVGLLVADLRSLPSTDWSWNKRGLGAGLLMTGVLSACVATALQIQHLPVQLVTALWLLALIAITGGVAMIESAGSQSRFVQRAALAFTMCLALALRVADLNSVPAFVSFDEAVVGNQARLILNGQLPSVFGVGWEKLPALSFATYAATMAIFGDNLFGLRMSSVVFGVLSVGLLYLLVRRLWGERPAVLASVLLACSAWHIHFSRAGDHQVQAPFVLLLALYLLVRGVQDRSILAMLLAGFAVGASLELYYGARLTPVLLGVYLAHRALLQRDFLRVQARGLATLLIGAVIFLAPMAIVWSRTPDGFASRARVNILLPENLSHSMDALHVDNVWAVVGQQLRAGAEVLGVRGVWGVWPADHFDDPTPLLDPWMAGLVAVGIVAILLRPRSSGSVLLAGWLLLGLLLSAGLVVDQPDPGRLLAFLPALVIVAALALDEIWRGASFLSGRLANALLPLPILLVLGLVLYANVDNYFRVFPEHQPATALTLASEYAARMGDHYQIYMIGGSNWSLDNEVSHFLAPDADAINVKQAALQLPLEGVPGGKGAAFVIEGSQSDADGRLAPIRTIYPGGFGDVVSLANGKPAFVSYVIDNSALVGAQRGSGCQ